MTIHRGKAIIMLLDGPITSQFKTTDVEFYFHFRFDSNKTQHKTSLTEYINSSFQIETKNK